MLVSEKSVFNLGSVYQYVALIYIGSPSSVSCLANHPDFIGWSMEFKLDWVSTATLCCYWHTAFYCPVPLPPFIQPSLPYFWVSTCNVSRVSVNLMCPLFSLHAVVSFPSLKPLKTQPLIKPFQLLRRCILLISFHLNSYISFHDSHDINYVFISSSSHLIYILAQCFLFYLWLSMLVS